MKKKRQPRTPINENIRATKVRLVSEEEHFGVVDIETALKKAQEKGLDLVQITTNVNPPVCKIVDFGRYSYEENKKKKKQEKTSKTQEKAIRLGFAISEHDMDVRMRSAEKFLAAGDYVKIIIPLRGRQRALEDVAREKLQYFLNKVEEKVEVKVEKPINKEPRGLTVTIIKK